MGFHLKLTDGHALVGGKPKKANEQVLIKKFGEAEYKRVKESFPRCIAVVVRAGRGVECTSIPPLRGVQTDCAQRSEGMGKERRVEPADGQRRYLARLSLLDVTVPHCLLKCDYM